MTNIQIRYVLSKLGDVLSDYYKNVLFDGIRNSKVKLLMDSYTFSYLCQKLIDNDTEQIVDGENFKIDSKEMIYNSLKEASSLAPTETYNYYNNDSKFKIALALSSFQVLICNEFNVNEEGGNIQVCWDTFRNEIPDIDINSYREMTKELWIYLSDEIQRRYGKTLDLPIATGGPWYIIRYPLSQRYFEAYELREILYIFGRIHWNDLTTDPERAELKSRDELFTNFVKYSELEKDVIYLYYKIWFNKYLINADKEDINSFANEAADTELVYYDISEKTLKNQNENEFNCSEYIGIPFYYSDFYECFVNQKPEAEEDDLIGGLFVRQSEIKTYNFTFAKNDTKDEAVKFISFDVIKESLPSDIYRKFSNGTGVKNTLDYKVVEGIKIDGRANIYNRFYPPKIIFNFDINEIEKYDDVGRRTVLLKNNSFKFDKKDLFNSKQTVIKYRNAAGTYKEIHFIFVHPQQIDVNKPEYSGWNIKTLEPADKDLTKGISGFKLILPNNNTVKTKQTDRKYLEKNSIQEAVSSQDFLLKNKFVDCSLYGAIDLLPLTIQTITQKFDELINKLDLFEYKEYQKILFDLFDDSLAKTITSSKKFISVYWLIKKLIVEYSENQKDYTLVVFYSKNNKGEVLIPYVAKIPYRENLYDLTSHEYFSSIICNGRRMEYPVITYSRFVVKLNKFADKRDSIEVCLKNLFQNFNITTVNSSSNTTIDYVEYLKLFEDIKLIDVKMVVRYGMITYKLKVQDTPFSAENKDSNHIPFEEENWRFLPYKREDSNSSKVNNVASNVPYSIQIAQTLLYTYIQSKGTVTWQNIKHFVKENTTEDVNGVFFPLHYIGAIEVCKNNGIVKYCVSPDLNISFYKQELYKAVKLSKIIPNTNEFEERCWGLAVENTNEIEDKIVMRNKAKALNILKDIASVETVVKSWTKVSKLVSEFKFIWDFGNHKDIRPGFTKIKSDNFIGMCRADVKERAFRPSYFRASLDEYYQIPLLNVNPGAERVAKCYMRSLLKINDRLVYDKKSQTLTCHLSDLPLPVIRALNILDPWNIYKIAILPLNKKEFNTVEYRYVDDEIFEQIKRIFSEDSITIEV